METEIKGINKKLDDNVGKFENHVKEQKSDFFNLNEKIDKILDKLEKKFAAKWVENTTLSILVIIIASAIIAVANFMATQ